MSRELRLFYEEKMREYHLLKEQYQRQQMIIEVLLSSKVEDFLKENIRTTIHSFLSNKQTRD